MHRTLAALLLSLATAVPALAQQNLPAIQAPAAAANPYGLGALWAQGDIVTVKMTLRSGLGLFLNRPQINTSAAYGFNPPVSEMATVINGNVDAPAGA